MSFRVEWDQEPQDYLTVLWMDATDRAAITRAGSEIDRRLASEPYRWGTPLMEGLYLIECPPLRVAYEVFEEDKVVKVVSLSLSLLK